MLPEYWKSRCLAAEDYIAKSPCDPDITPAQIEAYAVWQEIKNNPPDNTFMGMPVVITAHLQADQWMIAYPHNYVYRINEHHNGDELDPISYWEVHQS